MRRDHLAGCPHLAPQRLQGALLLDEIGTQGLERQVDPQLQIPGTPDLAHAAAPQQRADAIALTEDLSRRQRVVGEGEGFRLLVLEFQQQRRRAERHLEQTARA